MQITDFEELFSVDPQWERFRIGEVSPSNIIGHSTEDGGTFQISISDVSTSPWVDAAISEHFGPVRSSDGGFKVSFRFKPVEIGDGSRFLISFADDTEQQFGSSSLGFRIPDEKFGIFIDAQDQSAANGVIGFSEAGTNEESDRAVGAAPTIGEWHDVEIEYVAENKQISYRVSRSDGAVLLDDSTEVVEEFEITRIFVGEREGSRSEPGQATVLIDEFFVERGGEASTIEQPSDEYSEDFSVDPQWEPLRIGELSASNVLARSTEDGGTFKVSISDISTTPWAEFAISESFGPFESSNGDFTVSFRFKPVEIGEGSRFLVSFADDTEQQFGSSSLGFRIPDEKFGLLIDAQDPSNANGVVGFSEAGTDGENELAVGLAPAVGEWHDVEIHYVSASEEINYLVKRADGAVLLSDTTDVVDDFEISRILVGEREGSRSEPGQATVLLDDFEIRTGGGSAPITQTFSEHSSLGRNFADDRAKIAVGMSLAELVYNADLPTTAEKTDNIGSEISGLRLLNSSDFGLSPSLFLDYIYDNNGLYKGFNSQLNTFSEAVVAEGFIDGKKTLILSFRGTDSDIAPALGQAFTAAGLKSQYEAYDVLIEEVIKYVADPGNFIESMIVSGHSLGGSLVDYSVLSGDSERFIEALGGPGEADFIALSVASARVDPDLANPGFIGALFGLALNDIVLSQITKLDQPDYYYGISHEGDFVTFPDQAPLRSLPVVLRSQVGYGDDGDRIVIETPNFSNEIDAGTFGIEHNSTLYRNHINELIRSPLAEYISEGRTIIIGNGQSLVDIANDLDEDVDNSIINDAALAATNDPSFILGLEGNDVIFGGLSDDVLDGGDGSDTISAFDGDDTLSGGKGNDTLEGEDGVDVAVYTGNSKDYLIIQSGQNVIVSFNGGNEAPGNDDGTDVLSSIEILEFADGMFAIEDLVGKFAGSAEADVIRGGSGTDVFRGLGGDDIIIGGAGDDRLSGQGGDDTLKGGGGDDNIKGNGGEDVIRGNGGNDFIRAGGGVDNAKGGGGADLIFGGGGADRLNGGGGADTLRGNGGDDTLKGNGGADVFQFRANDRNDTIVDFRQGQDKIQIQSGANSFEALRIEQDGRDVLIGFGAGQVRIVTDNAAAFSEDDFIF